MAYSIKWLESLPPHLYEAVKDQPPEVIVGYVSDNLGYSEPLPTIDEFIEDPQYLGKALWGGASVYGTARYGGLVFPLWRKLLRKIYPNPYYSPYSEIILSGAIGTGKTTVAKIGILYDLYRMCKLKSIVAHYDLSLTTPIMFALINATKDLTERVLGRELMDWLQGSAKFREMIIKTARKGEPFLPHKLGLQLGSRVGDTLGTAVPGCLLDELNFQNKVANQAMDNYNGIKARMTSRFFNGTLGFPGRMWLASSTTLDSSFVNDLISKNADNAKVLYVSKALWEVRDHQYGQYERFPVFIGDTDKDPFIIDDLIAVQSYIDPDRIIQVPVVLRDQFEKDIYKNLQDLAGISTISNFAYINSKEKLNQAMHLPRNWVDKEILSVDMYDHDDTLVKKLDREAFVKRMNPTYLRFIHIDLGYAHDKTGIGICHIGGFVNRRRYDPLTGNTSVSTDPWFIVDCVMAVEKKPGQEVPLFKIRDLMLDLRTIGLPIAMVSTDGHQSVQMRQELTVAGFEAELISCDRTKDPHSVFKQALYEGRVSLPRHELLARELLELKDTGQKFDHPLQGSKDVADGLVGCVYSAWLLREQYMNPVSGLADLRDMDFINDPEKALGYDRNDSPFGLLDLHGSAFESW